MLLNMLIIGCYLPTNVSLLLELVSGLDVVEC